MLARREIDPTSVHWRDRCQHLIREIAVLKQELKANKTDPNLRRRLTELKAELKSLQRKLVALISQSDRLRSQ
jgi:hypothetical protein